MNKFSRPNKIVVADIIFNLIEFLSYDNYKLNVSLFLYKTCKKSTKLMIRWFDEVNLLSDTSVCCQDYMYLQNKANSGQGESFLETRGIRNIIKQVNVL